MQKAKEAEKDARLENLPFNYWYKETALEEALDASPVWVKVKSLDGHFPAIYSDCPIFCTQVEDQDFLRYVKSLILMKGPDGKGYLVRFYTPAYLHNWLSKIGQERINLLLGPISSIKYFFNKTHNEINNAQMSILTNKKDVAWFKINKPEWEMLKKAYSARDNGYGN